MSKLNSLQSFCMKAWKLYQAVVKYKAWIRTQVSWTQIRHRPRRCAAEEEQEDVDGPDLVLEQLLHRQAVLVVAT